MNPINMQRVMAGNRKVVAGALWAARGNKTTPSSFVTAPMRGAAQGLQASKMARYGVIAGGGLLALTRGASMIDRLQNGDLGGAAMDGGLAAAGAYAVYNHRMLAQTLQQALKNARNFVK